MTAWAQDELQKIAAADDLRIAPFRADATTYGTPTWIWSVAVDGDLYVRAYNGQSSRWHQAAMRQKAGRILAGGLTKEVAFEPVDADINDRIDEAYRAKYRGSPYLNPMIRAYARAATVRITRAIPTAHRTIRSGNDGQTQIRPRARSIGSVARRDGLRKIARYS